MINPKKLTLKQLLAQLTSRQGLIGGSVLGLIASLVSLYFLVPIFEKSEENAVDIIEVTTTLNDTTSKFEQTSEQLTQTSKDLATSNQKLAELKLVEVELFSANDRISDLKESSQKNETTIINLEEEINNKNSNIESLKDRTRALKNNIASKKAALTKRAEWINDLKKRDDEIVDNAMHLVDNFMKISDTNNAFGEVSSASRDELLVDTLTLVNTLDTQRNQRKMFVEDLSQKLQK